MSYFDITYIANLFTSLIMVILLIIIVSYINKLEKQGCDCSNVANRDFIKKFSMFAIIYLLITMFIPHKLIVKTLGTTFSLLLSIVNIIFIAVSVYFWYLTFNYTRYLVNEKCKCSENISRDIIMVGSLIEIILIFFMFILGLILALVSSIVMTTFNYINKYESELKDTVRNPMKSIKKIPSKVKSSLKDVSSILKGTSKNVKRLIKKNS
jgi:hypothetical protein